MEERAETLGELSGKGLLLARLGGGGGGTKAGGQGEQGKAKGGDERQSDAAAGHLLEEQNAGEGEEDIGGPDAKEWRNFALGGEGDTDARQEVVDEGRAGW